MPLTGPRAEDTDIRMIAGHEKRITRLEQRKSGGFDPNADPIIIGQGAADHTGDVGEIAIGKNAETGDPAYTGGVGNLAIGFGAEAGGLSDDDDSNTAVGTDVAASGGGAVAIGTSLARSAHTIAIGKGQATDTGATAIGHMAHATNPDSLAIGSGSHANTDSATALGANAGAVGQAAVALGSNAAAGTDVFTPADYAVAVGSGSSAYGERSVVIGYQAQATISAAPAVAVGANTYANGVNSTAVGPGARAGDHELVLGTDTENVIMPGAVAMPGLPTADPLVSGAVWNDGGILTVSP